MPKQTEFVSTKRGGVPKLKLKIEAELSIRQINNLMLFKHFQKELMDPKQEITDSKLVHLMPTKKSILDDCRLQVLQSGTDAESKIMDIYHMSDDETKEHIFKCTKTVLNYLNDMWGM